MINERVLLNLSPSMTEAQDANLIEMMGGVIARVMIDDIALDREIGGKGDERGAGLGIAGTVIVNEEIETEGWKGIGKGASVETGIMTGEVFILFFYVIFYALANNSYRIRIERESIPRWPISLTYSKRYKGQIQDTTAGSKT